MTFPLLTFTVPGPPVPWERAVHAGGQVFTTSKSRAYRKAIASAFLVTQPPKWPTDGRYEVSVSVTFADRRRRDLDNVGKAVGDALNGLAWLDDSQIDEWRISRAEPDKNHPGLRVTIRALAQGRAA